jgi:hypothetical protein
LLASGCSLQSERDQADFIVEARAGAIGTDRNDLLFGVPSMNVPQIMPVQPVAAAIPEVPIAKRRDQRGIAKIAVFAYHRQTGTPVWQSGIAHEESSANDVWILGAGPFQRGTIYEGTAFAGNTLASEDSKAAGRFRRRPPLELARERTFTMPQQLVNQAPPPPVDPGVLPASHEEPVAAAGMSAAMPLAAARPHESDPVRVALPPAATQGATQPRAVVSAEIYDRPVSRSTGELNPQTLFPDSADPIPLPQPRVGVPQR